MQDPADVEGPRHAGARGAIITIVNEILTAEQLRLLDSSLGDISKELLRGVVHDGLGDDAALHRAHAVAELADIRAMLPVETGST